jgi:hypothetical protein
VEPLERNGEDHRLKKLKYVVLKKALEKNEKEEKFIVSVHVQFLVNIISIITLKCGQAVAQLVEALRYKPEGHGFDSRLRNFSGRTMALGSTQPLT